jgi:hypothetical protein
MEKIELRLPAWPKTLAELRFVRFCLSHLSAIHYRQAFYMSVVAGNFNQLAL